MSEPTSSRTSATGMSSCPTCTPSAPDLARDERPVVDDQQRAEPLAQRPRGVGDSRQLVVGEMLLAQLHDVHAAGDRPAQQVRQGACAGRGGVGGRLIGDRPAHEVQPRGGQTSAPLGAEVSDGHRSPV